MADPLNDNVANIVAHGKGCRRECLAELRAHFASVLDNATALHIDVLDSLIIGVMCDRRSRLCSPSHNSPRVMSHSPTPPRGYHCKRIHTARMVNNMSMFKAIFGIMERFAAE